MLSRLHQPLLESAWKYVVHSSVLEPSNAVFSTAESKQMWILWLHRLTCSMSLHKQSRLYTAADYGEVSCLSIG